LTVCFSETAFGAGAGAGAAAAAGAGAGAGSGAFSAGVDAQPAKARKTIAESVGLNLLVIFFSSISNSSSCNPSSLETPHG
jgi:hypothetical protein